MSTRRIVLLILFLTGAFLLAFLLAGPARDLIILPLAKFWWMLKGLYGSYPQIEYWILLVVVVAALLLFSLFGVGWNEGRGTIDEGQRNPGEVQQLAYWIARGRKGFYSRWHVARRLGELALEILESSGHDAKTTRRLKGSGWDPPPNVQAYLESALRTSFADFSRRRANGLEKSLDIDVSDVVAYLESVLEIENEHKNP